MPACLYGAVFVTYLHPSASYMVQIILLNFPVSDMDNPFGLCRNVHVMGDDDDGLPFPV